jgi:hypothetical protein
MKRLLLLLAATTLIGAAPRTAAQKLAQIDRTFICPEDLPDEETRQVAATLFTHLSLSAGYATPRQITLLRTRLLRSHQCWETLANMRRNQRP